MNPPDGARIVQVRSPPPRACLAPYAACDRAVRSPQRALQPAGGPRPCDRGVQLEALYVSVLQSLSAELHALHLTSLSNQSVIYAV